MDFLNLGNEMIQYQHDDILVEELKTEFDTLIEFGLNNSVSSGSNFFKRKVPKEAIENIDKIIYQRFGIRLKHIHGEGVGYAIITVPPKNANVIAMETLDKYNYVKGVADTCNDGVCRGVPLKEYNDIKDMEKDQTSIFYHTKKSFDAMEDALNSQGVEIDLKNAMIKNLPEDYKLFSLVDLYMMIIELNLTSLELTSVLLHEVGHGFTHIEESYRTIQNTSVIINTLRENLNNKVGLTNSMVLINEEFKLEVNKEGKNEIGYTVAVIDKMTKNFKRLNRKNVSVGTDSEQLADQFASRFGLGVHLASALNKMNKKMPSEASVIIGMSTGIALYAGFIVLLQTMSMAAAIIGFSVVWGTLLSLFFVAMIMKHIIFGTTDAHENTYDNNQRRIIRIKNDAVRILRQSDLPIRAIKEKIKEIDEISKIAKETKTGINWLSKKFDYLPWNKKYSDQRLLEELTEDLMENSLHIMQAKFKTLGE